MANVKRLFIEGAIPTKEEVGAMKLIIMKKQISHAGMENREFPDGVDQAIMTAYYKAAMDNFAEAQYSENEWWKAMTAKFNLPTATHLDFDAERFYTVEETN
jgi:hypothetical protein